ncbi:hypothetical protein BJ742DRAFT_815836 [Cladochytrium replicatum]|nr:hypothetical protein BJ742DRAFT_815836 [Cladochytrium replicatum]
MLTVSRQNQPKPTPHLPPSQHTVFQNLDKDSIPHRTSGDDAFQRAATARVLAASTLIGLKVLAAHIDASRDRTNSKQFETSSRNWTLGDVENITFALGIRKVDLHREEQYNLIALALYLDRDSLQQTNTPSEDETAGRALVRALYPSWWGHAEHIASHRRSPQRTKHGKTPPPDVDVWSYPKKMVDEWTQTLDSFMLTYSNTENVRHNRRTEHSGQYIAILTSEDESSDIPDTNHHARRRMTPLRKDQLIQTKDSSPFEDRYTQAKIERRRKDGETGLVDDYLRSPTADRTIRFVQLDQNNEQYSYGEDTQNRREQSIFGIDTERGHTRDRTRGRIVDSPVTNSTRRLNLGAKKTSHSLLRSGSKRRHKPYAWSIPVKKKGVLGTPIDPDSESSRALKDMKAGDSQMLSARERRTRDPSFASIGFTEDSGLLNSIASGNETNIINIALDFLQGGFAEKFFELEELNDDYKD